MEFEEWEPVYEAILADFGYDRAADEQARDILVDLFEDTGLFEGAESFDPVGLDLAGNRVAVAGDAPSLPADVAMAANADAVVATAGATAILRERDVSVDCTVTDLDTDPAAIVESAARGHSVVVHAHGDNIEALRTYVPRLDGASVIATTQAEPTGPVRNFGGFTDGDRGAFLADALGAESLVFPGWDFDDPHVTAVKRRKLQWAERLLYWLERRRSESFAILDGRRDGIETTDLPI